MEKATPKCATPELFLVTDRTKNTLMETCHKIIGSEHGAPPSLTTSDRELVSMLKASAEP